LHALCGGSDHYNVSIDSYPPKILSDYGYLEVALFASTPEEPSAIRNLMLPSIRSFLKSLASGGLESEGITRG
jgi:hypothetical protein